VPDGGAVNGQRAAAPHRQGASAVVVHQSCDNGVMYGWGSPIGNYNNSLPALYAFSFAKKRNELAP
jgi:hypothetical protein